MANINDDSEFASTVAEGFSELANMASDQFFVDLGELSSDERLAVADFASKLVERRLDSMRCLEENNCSAHRSNFIEPRFSVFGPNRWEA